MSVPVQLRRGREVQGTECALYFHVFSRSWAIGSVVLWLVPFLFFLPFAVLTYPVTTGTAFTISWQTFGWMTGFLFLGLFPAMAAGLPVWIAIRKPLMAVGIGPRVAMALAIVPTLWAGLAMVDWLTGFAWFPGPLNFGALNAVTMWMAAIVGLIVAFVSAFDPALFPEEA